MAEHEGKASSSGESAEAMRRKRKVADIMLDESKEAAETLDPFNLLLGQVISRPSIERHAALLSDNRFSYPANAGQKARFVLQLQQSYGNKYVQRVVDLVQVKRQYDLSNQKLTTNARYDTMTQLGQDQPHESTTASWAERTYENIIETGEELPAQEVTAIGAKSHLIQAQPKEGAGKPKTEQSIYRFEVCFVDDGKRAKLQVGEEEEKAEFGAKEAEKKPKAPDVKSYGYIGGNHWAYEASTDWESGKLVPVKVAEDNAIKALDSALESIDKSSLDEEKKAVARSKVLEIAGEVVKCFTGRAPKSEYKPPKEMEGFFETLWEAEELQYKWGMNKGVFTSIEFLEDKVIFKLGTEPAKEPEEKKPEEPKEPKLDIMNPIVVDQFEFNKFDLPTQGEGVKHLIKLCKLPAKIKAEIVIKRITGHTDKVPVRRPGRRFATLKELSMKRIQPVRKLLEDAKFTPLPPGEALEDKEAQFKAEDSNEVRAKDRKVVVEWERKKST